jgi:hypothetical protein
MTATKTQLTGGAFQDSEGNVLNLGYLIFKLNQDNSVAGVGNICAGIEVKILLNSSGSISTSPQQFIWATDVFSTVNSFYTVTGYTAAGQPAWGPNNQQVVSGGTGGGTFDVGLWVPNSVFSWTPPIQPLTLRTNGVLNGSQTTLNLKQGANVALTDDGVGGVTIAVTGITGITLKTNGTQNGSQVLLNLKQGSGISVTDDGVGGVTIVNTSPGGNTGGGVLGLWPGYWIAYTNAGSSNGAVFDNGRFGMNPGQIGGSYPAVIIPATATEPRGARIQAAGLSACSGIQDQQREYTLGTVRDWFMKGGIFGLTSARYWVGFSDSAIANTPTVMNSDTPAANVVGFRWSSGVDTHFQAICQTGNTHQTVVDTGITPVSGVPHTFEIVPTSNGTVIQFYIDLNLVATISTNVPTTSTGMYSLFTVDAKGSGISDFNFDFYYMYALLSN